jgi:hypothetical protein
MKSKKGFVIGAGLLAVVVLLAVFVLMAFLVIFSAGARIVKSPDSQSAYLSAQPQEIILLNPIELTLKDGAKKQILIIDAIIEGTLAQKRYESISQDSSPEALEERQKIANHMSSVKEAIKTSLEKQITEKKCLTILQNSQEIINTESLKISGNGKDISFVFENGKGEENHDLLMIQNHKEKNMFSKVPEFTAEKFQTSQTFSIEYYFGDCDYYE